MILWHEANVVRDRNVPVSENFTANYLPEKLPL